MESNLLKTYFIYINGENDIMQIKEKILPVNNENIIPKMNFIHHIQTMKKDEMGSYILKNIAIHHVVLNDNNIRDYIANKIPPDTFFKEISYLSDIILQPTNPCFHPISALYVILQEKPHITEAKSQTKKIRFTHKKTTKRKSLKQKY
jgi:hypothetical protein